MFDITVFTVCYNNYGRFLRDWLEGVFNQEVSSSKVIVVLGESHGVGDKIIKYYSGRGVVFLYSQESNMGKLRNVALREVETEWVLYMSIDDTLLPIAIKQIKEKSKGCDYVALRYLLNQLNQESFYFTQDNIDGWEDETPGYIAFKSSFNEKKLLYEPTDIPNFPFLYKLFRKGMVVGKTDKPCIIYNRRKNSHSFRAIKEGKRDRYISRIRNHIDKFRE